MSPRLRASAAVRAPRSPRDVAPAPSASGSARSSASSASRPRRPWRGRRITRLAAAERDHAEPVAAPRRHVADRQRHALGDVGLAPVGGAERHRGGDVEQQPGGHRALADVHAHVRLAHPRGHVPVDVAHVVARPVGADQRELGAAADLRREVLARHEALDPPQHREIEVAQDRRRDRAGPRPLGRALRRGQTRRACGASRAAAHGSLPIRSSASTAAASSSASAAPANDEVTSCLTFLVENFVPRFA